MDCLPMDYTHAMFFRYHGVRGGIRARGKYKNGCGDSWKDQDCYLGFNHTSFSTDRLFLNE